MKRSTILSSAALATALGVLVAGTLVSAPTATAYGPGGWDRIGHGATASNPSLNGEVLALNTDLPGKLLVAGKFTDAGGLAAADKVASWNGTAWSALGPGSSITGDVYALAVHNGNVYAGGGFVNAGGDANADNLAVWNGSTWSSVCVGTAALTGNVKALEVIGDFLYVGGEFGNGGGNADADYLMRCNLTNGVISSTTNPGTEFTGPVYALTTYGGNLVAGGNFQGLQFNSASDFVAQLVGSAWTNLGASSTLDGAVTGIVRSVSADGPFLYVGSDGVNIDEIAQADHVARWTDGTNSNSSWIALGANTAGTDGYLPAVTPITALLADGNGVWVGGSWLNANGDPLADAVALFYGAWDTIGSNGAGNGPLSPKANAFALFGGKLHAGGPFTSAGGDGLAQFLAKYAPQPSNVVTIPKVKFNKTKGTATVFVKVPFEGTITMRGSGIKPFGRVALAQPVPGAGTVKLKVRPKAKTKEKLRDKGKAKVTLKITFKPTGGTANTETKTIKLKLND